VIALGDLPKWLRLFRVAHSLIEQVNSTQPIIDYWTFGGGTAMMLQIDHRESNDVDIFLSDPQALQFLDPQKRDFQFEIHPDDCRGDGARSLKLAFYDIGQIDFIVAGSLTATPTTEANVDGQMVLLETISEIITKKIYYRASSIQARDIFDIAAAGEHNPGALIDSLRMHRDRVTHALATISNLNIDFVNRAIQQLAIKDGYIDVAKTALERSKELLRAV
jgi:nucleotidyltransferase AbiEii toxin of type IV toxin-antitoxin system